MRKIRIVLWAAVVVVGGLVAWSSFQWQKAEVTGTTLVKIGGPFELVSNKGEVITDKSISGKPYLMFFGFTHCPDVCPTTLYEASGWLKALGADADKINVYFVTVDPERDTQQVMAEYVAAFDPRITGITGDPAKVELMLKSYKVFFKKVPDPDDPEDYSMDHTALVYMMKKDGDFFGTIDYGEDNEVALQKIRRLLSKS